MLCVTLSQMWELPSENEGSAEIVFTLWYELQMDIGSSFNDFNDQMHKLRPVFCPKANSFTSVLVSMVLNCVELDTNSQVK